MNSGGRIQRDDEGRSSCIMWVDAQIIIEDWTMKIGDRFRWDGARVWGEANIPMMGTKMQRSDIQSALILFWRDSSNWSVSNISRIEKECRDLISSLHRNSLDDLCKNLSTDSHVILPEDWRSPCSLSVNDSYVWTSFQHVLILWFFLANIQDEEVWRFSVHSCGDEHVLESIRKSRAKLNRDADKDSLSKENSFFKSVHYHDYELKSNDKDDKSNYNKSAIRIRAKKHPTIRNKARWSNKIKYIYRCLERWELKFN